MKIRNLLTAPAATLTAIMFLSIGVFAQHDQKGVDTQTQTIKEEGNKVTTRPNDATHSINWGKDKTKVRDLLPNPYKMNSRRDVLVNTIIEALKDKKMVVDDASSRIGEGIIVTQPFVFAKGAVITRTELYRYGLPDAPDTAWTRGQYTLTIEVQSIDGIQNNVSVTAKVEGRAGNGLTSEWLNVRSSGVAEDEFLSKLVELVTGNSPDPAQDTQ